MLEVRALSLGNGPAHALRDVDLTVRAGEIVAVAGEPGAGKTTLVRAAAGDLAPEAGEVLLSGRAVPADPAAAGRRGIAAVWQVPALCDNLDVAGNILLGRETRRLMLSESRFHAEAAAILDRLGIPIADTRRLVGSLTGGQRQLVAMATALSRDPRLLVLDEPTASLGVAETGQVEALITAVRDRGGAILMTSRDSEQMFRVADRIVVLRRGRAVAELNPATTHPDDLAALLSGQQVDSSARRQLTRLHGLADRLVSADPSSSLSLILSALGSALGSERACIHVVNGWWLVCAASFGFSAEEIAPLSRLPFGVPGGPVGQAAGRGETVVEDASWSVPVIGPVGVSAVITVFRSTAGAPGRDELDLLTLYAGYAAAAVERDRLLDEVTSRNRVLETIREMLETLAGPVAVGEGLTIALESLRRGLQADEVALLVRAHGDTAVTRAYWGPHGPDHDRMSDALGLAARDALADPRRDGTARDPGGALADRVLAVPFTAPTGPAALLATWGPAAASAQETALIEDAAHSLRLALEREEAGIAHQEASALRRSRQLQRSFLSRLSHELRTPLTAIRGYATSLMAPDVTWDGESQGRFLDRIAAESARVGRLVDDLLDFSAIESGVMRLQRDWCDLRLVAEAAVSCLPAEQAAAVQIEMDPVLPTVWADHDRLEQLFVNLLTNAFRHNPPGTRVTVSARETGDLRHGSEAEITVSDDGAGFPAGLVAAPFDTARLARSPSAGAGLGLSIARGIVAAHAGEIALVPTTSGTTFQIRLPVEGAPDETPAAEPAPGEPAPRTHA